MIIDRPKSECVRISALYCNLKGNFNFPIFRVNEINRYLVDFEVGTTASRMKHFFLPSFDLEKSGDRLKEVWPQILEQAMAK